MSTSTIVSVSDFLKDYSRPSKDEYIVTPSETNKKIYVFVSFDLCNSTLLKHKSLYWFDIISTFLDSHQYLTQMDCWKFNGDEILYYAEIKSVFEIIELLKEAYAFIDKAKDLLINTVKKLSKTKNDTRIDDELSLMDIKGTIWIAQTNDIEFKNDDILNYRFVINKTMDFSGINIDEGFRLRGWASRHKLVVDPKIATILFLTNQYLQEHELPISTDKLGNFIENAERFDSHKEIVKIKEFLDNFKILGYQPCKGVWNGHLYPVIWYADDWKTLTNNLSYDEKFDGEYVVNILSRPNNKIYELQFLIDVLTQVKEIDTVTSILNKLCFENIKGRESTTTKVLNSTTNLYYMVVCVNPSSGNALMFKRSKCRKHLKNVWDFGNIKHISNKDIPMNKIISMQYKSAFGLDINVCGDDNRIGSFIAPLALCTIHRYGKMHNGILCVAEILGNKTDDELRSIVKDNIKKTQQRFPESYQYVDVAFVNGDNFEQYGFRELTFQEIEQDSFMAEIGMINDLNQEGKQTCINNCKDSIIKALSFFKK